MSVGEVTVTLQDVNCLWDFCITSYSIIGPSDQDLQKLIERNQRVGMSNALLKLMKKKSGESQE
jgi:hypothetical protein